MLIYNGIEVNLNKEEAKFKIVLYEGLPILVTRDSVDPAPWQPLVIRSL